MFSESGELVWSIRLSTWGTVRGVRKVVPPPANDDFEFIAPPPKTRGNLALKPAAEEAAYDCPIRFPGQWQDEETGLYYNRHRYYDPLAAQYTSPDPIGLEGGARPQGYVDCPNVWVDIQGLNATFFQKHAPGGDPSTLPRASEELLNSVMKKREVVIAKPGSDDLRYMTQNGIEASMNTMNPNHILIRPNPTRGALLEEFLHGTQLKTGVMKRLGGPSFEPSVVQKIEHHVKDFMIRHRNLLRLNDAEVNYMKTLIESGL